MNAPATPTSQAAISHGPRRLDAIVEIHGQVGDGLTDQDLTCLSQASGLPTEAGFALLQELSSLYRSDAARTVPQPPDRTQMSAGQALSPEPGNLGELGGASGALGEEWTLMFEQPLKPTTGHTDNGSRSPSHQVLHNQA